MFFIWKAEVYAKYSSSSKEVIILCPVGDELIGRECYVVELRGIYFHDMYIRIYSTSDVYVDIKEVCITYDLLVVNCTIYVCSRPKAH